MAGAAPTYRVRNWTKLYEVSDAKRAGPGKPLAWVAVPTKHDGRGFRRLMRQAQGPLIFAAFILIVEVAAKMPHRGTLEDADGPLTPQDLADKTGAPESIFQLAFQVLTDETLGINWLEVSRDTSRYPVKPCTSVSSVSSCSVNENRFSEFWEWWPTNTRKVARRTCQEYWNDSHLDAEADAILSGLKQAKRSINWTKESGRFIPSPMKWLEDRGWEAFATNAPAPDLFDAVWSKLTTEQRTAEVETFISGQAIALSDGIKAQLRTAPRTVREFREHIATRKMMEAVA